MTQPASSGQGKNLKSSELIFFSMEVAVFLSVKLHLAAFWTTTLTIDMICWYVFYFYTFFTVFFRHQNSQKMDGFWPDDSLAGFESKKSPVQR